MGDIYLCPAIRTNTGNNQVGIPAVVSPYEYTIGRLADESIKALSKLLPQAGCLHYAINLYA